jgi:heat shock protein HtpX
MYKAIADNKRNTIVIMILFVLFIGAIGWTADYLTGGDGSTGIMVVLIAAVYALIQYFAASKLAIMMSGAKQIEKSDNPRLYRSVENLAITLGLPTPKIYTIEDSAPNAFATGRDPKHAVVAATTGLLDVMDDTELEAVLAHEMGHIQNYDIRVSMIVFGLVSAVGIISDIALRMMFFGGDRDREDQNPIAMIIGLIVIILAPIVAMLVQFAVSRQREYLADASGVMTTRHPDGLIKALKKLQKFGRPMRRQSTSTSHMFFNNPLSAKSFAKLFSTHPPLEERIARLENNTGKF